MEKKHKIIIAIVLILLISLVVKLNSSKEDQNVFKYNNFNIYQTAPAVYNIEIFLENDQNPHYISIRYDPRDLENIEVEENLKERILRDELFITLDKNLTSESVVALSELSKIIGNKFLFNIPINSALTYEKDNIPVKTCSDVTTTTSVIMLKLADQTRVYRKSDCIVVEGKTEEEIVKASTKLILDLLGISKK